MEDQLKDYFSTTDFDVDVPRFGHLDRFEKRLIQKKKKPKISLK